MMEYLCGDTGGGIVEGNIVDISVVVTDKEDWIADGHVIGMARICNSRLKEYERDDIMALPSRDQ